MFVVRLALAAVFAVAAAGKLRDRARAADSLEAFAVPRRLAGLGAIALPLAELAVAVLLIPNATARAGAIGALILLAVFAVAIAAALRRGDRPDCNCFGDLHSAPAGWGTLARNGVLAAAAAAVLIAGPGRPVGEALDGVAASTAVLVAVLALALAAQLAFTWQLFRQNGRLVVRVRALERRAGILMTEPAGPRAAADAQGLERGAPAPHFELPDLEGRPVSLAQLLSPRRQLALVFSDPGCGGCIEMLPELARIADEQADRLEVALVSTGDAEQNRARLDGASLTTVLLQDEHEVTVSYAARAMPSAVIVDSAGRIASALAIGGPRVIDLLGQGASGVADLELIEVGR